MLLEHNINVFNNLEQTLENNNCCCVIMGTGVGKTYVTSEYLDKYNLRALIVAPRHSICDSWQKHRSNIDTITYQKLSNIYKDIDFSNYDIVVCDEVHHIGAPTWGKPIKYLIDNNIIKVIGLTESSVRYSDGGKDVAEDFFYGNVAYGETVSSAIEKKILNPVTYVGAMFNSDGLKHTLRGKIQSRLYAKLNLALNKTPTVAEILKKHMPKGKRKGIIFASTIEDIKSAIEFVKSVYPKIEIKFVHSKQSQSYNNEAFEWFKNTKEGYICSVDMISEGVHIKGVNTLIMLRRTESVNLFNQQLGRCLDASSKEPAILFDLVNNKYSIRIINDKLKVKTNSIFNSKQLNIVPSEQLIINDYTKDIVEILEEIKINLEGCWTEEENNIIRKYYPIEGSECIKRLSKHTVQSLLTQAYRLGVTYNINLWTDEEIQILRDYYPIEGRNVYKRIPAHSKKSVISKVSALGLRTNRELLPWTKEEDDFILKNYASLGPRRLQEILTTRTYEAIVTHAQELGLKKSSPKVRCIETGQVFSNPLEAANNLNLKSAYANISIAACCRGVKQSAYGYHWKYVEEEN